jgi:hypothetical protein
MLHTTMKADLVLSARPGGALHCRPPHYCGQLRQTYHAVFAGHTATATLLQQPDQCTLATAIYDMIQHRTSVYLG